MDDPPGRAKNLSLDRSGIWVAESDTTISYPEEGNDLCYALEDDSFWFRHRNEAIVALLRRFPPPGMLFDVGGGNGFVAAAIERAGWQTVVVEPGRRGAENARARGLSRVVCATTDTAGFAAGSLPAVGLFDVLEHIADDVQFLKSLRRLMLPGGRIYLTVPAYQFLWSSEDTAAGHCRRHTTASVARALKAAGFQLEYQTYLFWFLPPAVFMLRTIPSWFGWRGAPSLRSARREHARGRGFAGWLIEKALGWERTRLARGQKIPIGGSCFAVARCC
jgi:SAM-dependent methyltransferase